MNSLRLRLLVFLGALAAAVALAVGGATYFSVRTEADALFDYQLRQMALSLRDQGRVSEDERAALQSGEFDYVVQIWSVDGVALYSTRPARPLPPRAVLGFSTVALDGALWRVFSAATPLRVVQVAQPLAVRDRLARAAAWRSLLPVAVAAPLVALAMGWLVASSMAPLGRLVAELRRRGVQELAPLPERGVPAEVAPLVQAFNGTLARLDEAFAAQREFVADAAHELRSPLTALQLQIGLLRDAADAAEREDAVQRLRAGIERARHLVEQLLALARADPAAAPPQQALDFAALAREAVADSMALAQQRGGQVTLHSDGPLPLQGDPQGLRGLVRNLVDNALLHGGPQPQVRLQLASEGDDAVLQVDDRGPGIPAEERERIFDRFHRREPGRGSGSGLGLAIVRAIARQHGGDAHAAEAPGGGARLVVRLPRRRGAPAPTRPAGTPP